MTIYFSLILIIFAALPFLLSNKFFFLLPFYVVFNNLLLGLFIFFHDKKSQVNRTFSAVAITLGLWSFCVFIGGKLSDVDLAFSWLKAAYVFGAWVPSLFFCFAWAFSGKKVKTSLFAALFLISFFFMFSSLSNLVIKEVKLTVWGNEVIPGCFSSFYLFFFLFVLGWAFSIIFSHYRSSSDKEGIKFMLWGALLTALFSIAANVLLPLFGISSFWFIGPYSTIFLVTFTAYAIVKHRLMDISVIISRAAAEVLAILFHAVIYSALYYFYFTYVSKMLGFPFWLATVAYGIVVAETHHNLRLFIQTTSDKLFLRGKYDYYKELANATSRVGEKLALPEILDVLYGTFSEVVEISSPRIFLPDNFIKGEKASARYVVYSRENHLPLLDGQEIKAESPLVKALVESRGPVFDGKEIDAALIVPCLLEDRLIAVFALGNKLSEEAYTDDDLRLLKALASQAAVALDHTRSYEKIKADLETAERQVERSQRLASLGTLTAGVTHEIRNPLTVIRAETERLPNQLRDQEYLKQHRDLLLKHIDRIAGIVQRMLGLAKVKDKRVEEIDLNNLLDSTLQLFTISRISVKKEFASVPSVKGDPEELQEVFVNLIQNAMDAMPEGGTLTLKTYTEGGRAATGVVDTGKGIPEEIREKIFDPFYSTRHEGVGLGLSIVYRIVRENGGDIKVESEVGKGSTFKVLF